MTESEIWLYQAIFIVSIIIMFLLGLGVGWYLRELKELWEKEKRRSKKT